MNTLILKLITSMTEAAVITVLDACSTQLICLFPIFRRAGLSLISAAPYAPYIFASTFFVTAALLLLHDLVMTTAELTTTKLKITD